MKRIDILALALLFVGGVAAPGMAAVGNFSLAAVPSDAEIALGEAYTLDVRVASGVAGIEAWAFGLCVDAALQEILAARPGDNFNTLRLGGPPEWWAINVHAGGVTQGVMLDTRAAAALGVIPESDPLSILKVDLRPTEAAADKVVKVAFCNTVGSPPVITAIMAGGAEYTPAVMTPSEVTVVRDPALLLSFTSSMYNLALLTGDPVKTVIKARSTANLYGFSFGVSHDAGLLRIVEVSVAEELRQALGNADPEFFVANLNPGNGSGFTVASYRAANGVVSDETTNLSIVGTLGRPAVPILYEIGKEAVPTVRGCAIVISDDPIEVEFIRGDINADGKYNLSDAVTLLRYLFSGYNLPYDCLDVADCNGDRKVDSADPIFLLGYLFSGGRPFPAPFEECGAIEDGIAASPCVSYPLCR